ncbi:RNA polymerase sigma factor [Rhizohabitans arisaemae]|uniref:RNA polymerase sigma factor n=1 Tax=Rhizohabitans arisaemae TaxID=2720610 RepID=UPI0024B252CD|nr:DUF6596 domain-containing protein [Rhizohabitans arisaemae]
MTRHTGAEQAHQEHWARLLALLTGELRDLDLAEECLQEAFAAAVVQWRACPPANPAAWLLTAARRRAVDHRRREETLRRKLPLLIADDWIDGPEESPAIPDERLRLVFTCCHPALSPQARIGLTLRCVAGMTVPRIARRLLVAEATMAARITRAKKRIAAAGIPYRVPSAEELPERLAGVLAVVYLIFTEGYAQADADSGGLAGEAIRLGRLLVELMPGESEARGLLSLMLLHNSRRNARTREGKLVLLPDQDRTLWRRAEIEEGLALLPERPAGPYGLQSAIAAEHARADRADRTDWPAIARRYAELEELTRSPVVRLNRAVAVAQIEGPEAALSLLEGLDRLLPRHHLLPAARADLLRGLGRDAEAVSEYTKALELVEAGVDRDFLLSRRTQAMTRLDGTAQM